MGSSPPFTTSRGGIVQRFRTLACHARDGVSTTPVPARTAQGVLNMNINWMDLSADSLPGLMKKLEAIVVKEIEGERKNHISADPRMGKFSVSGAGGEDWKEFGIQTSLYVDLGGIVSGRELQVRVRLSHHDSPGMKDGILHPRRSQITKVFIMEDIREAIRMVMADGESEYDWTDPDLDNAKRRALIEGNSVILSHGDWIDANGLRFFINPKKKDIVVRSLETIKGRSVKSLYLFLRDASPEEWEREGFKDLGKRG